MVGLGRVRRDAAFQMRTQPARVRRQLPGLRGQGAATVAQKIRDAGLVPQFKRLVNGGFGMVLSVEPGEGTSVRKGSTVVINLV